MPRVHNVFNVRGLLSYKSMWGTVHMSNVRCVHGNSLGLDNDPDASVKYSVYDDAKISFQYKNCECEEVFCKLRSVDDVWYHAGSANSASCAAKTAVNLARVRLDTFKRIRTISSTEKDWHNVQIVVDEAKQAASYAVKAATDYVIDDESSCSSNTSHADAIICASEALQASCEIDAQASEAYADKLAADIAAQAAIRATVHPSVHASARSARAAAKAAVKFALESARVTDLAITEAKAIKGQRVGC
jgi:hypothetical protein